MTPLNITAENTMRTKHSQSGVTLLELIVTLGIIGAVMAGVARLVDQYIDDTKGALTAQQMVTVGNAAQAYIKDNYATVMANATATTPAIVTVPMLSAAGYLQSGFSTTNNFGHSVCVLVLEPTANNLNALVVAEGGTAIDDLTLGSIAANIGAAGGGIYSSASTTLRGSMGGWSTAVGNFSNANASNLKCDGTAGTPTLAAGHPIMALWFANGDTTSGFLHRNDVPGRPDLNTMNTPIIMASVQTSGAVCATTGAIARDTNGALLTCQGGTWKPGSGGLTWKGSVASVASLPASGNSSGDAYRVSGAGNHVFIWDAQNNVWQGMVVDSSGNLTLPGLIYASGSNSSYGAITMQGSKNGYSGINFRDAAGNIAGTLMMSPTYSGFFNAADNNWRWYVDNAGNSYQPGNVQAGTLQVDTVVAEGSACAPDGKIAKSSATSGLILSCQSGAWKPIASGGDHGTFLTTGNYFCGLPFVCSVGNPKTGACSCPAGTSAYQTSFGWTGDWACINTQTRGYACH